jgi:lipopolysaccharide export system permease protein
MLGVTLVLLLVIMSARFLRYLDDAASGGLPTDVLFTFVGLSIPGFLELILPLGLFLGFLISYGQLYIDNEMTVLSCCGISPNRLLVYSLIPAFFVSLFVAYLSFVLVPWSDQQFDGIKQTQKQRTEFDTLTPGRFKEFGTGERITYTEKLSSDKKQMENVFISQQNPQGAGEKNLVTVLVADTGTQYLDEQTGSRFLLLKSGFRYDGTPGRADYRVTQFQEYGVKIPKPEDAQRRQKSKLKTTSELLSSNSLGDIAQLQWRISVPLMVLIITMIAVPLSRVNPRQGRFARLLPCIFMYLTYVSILTTTRTAVEDGNFSPIVGLWWVHLLFLGVGLALLGDLHKKLPWYQK